jgi:hypothetical protein
MTKKTCSHIWLSRKHISRLTSFMYGVLGLWLLAGTCFASDALAVGLVSSHQSDASACTLSADTWEESKVTSTKSLFPQNNSCA